MRIDIMVDLETMSSRNNAAIVQIGAYPFVIDGENVAEHDPERQLQEKFHINVDLNNCIEKGLHVDGNTVLWWLQQSESARMSLVEDPRPLHAALVEFNDWIARGRREAEPFYPQSDELVIWSHATFDTPILQHAYQVSGVPFLWHYRGARDVRTIVDLAGGNQSFEYPDRSDFQHVGWVDAWAQASVVQQAWKRLQGRA